MTGVSKIRVKVTADSSELDFSPAIETVSNLSDQPTEAAKEATTAFDDVAESIIQGFEHGGVVPSAASGFLVGAGSYSVPALLHPHRLVLPAPLSERVQRMTEPAAPKGGDRCRQNLFLA
jgi:hypothetical protein